MKKQTEAPTALRPQSSIQWRPRVLVFLAVVLLTGCAGGPPPPPPPPDPAQAKAEAKAREDFARSLPKPPER